MLAPVSIARHDSAVASWEIALARPRPGLEPFVRGFCGYSQRSAGPVRRRELPSAQVVLIIEFGPPAKIVDPRRADTVLAHPGGFVAGLDDAFALAETGNDYRAIQVNFTPIGAALFFGVPMNDLACRVLGLDDVLGAAGRRLAARLEETPGWERRFASLDDFIARRIFESARAVPPWIASAWRGIESSGGRLGVRALTADSGFSRRHVAASFRECLGMTPKRLARLVRFEHAIRGLEAGRYRDLASVALDCGFSDQAHFNREFHRFAGVSPGELLRRRLPDAGGFGA